MTKRNSEYFVYLIRGGDHVKIGITGGSPMRRLKTLQTGNPEPLELIDFRNMQTSGRAARIEAGLHKRFDDQRVNGEWFALDDAQVDEARGIIRDHADQIRADKNDPESWSGLPPVWQDWLDKDHKLKSVMQDMIPRPNLMMVSATMVDACDGDSTCAHVLSCLIYDIWTARAYVDVVSNCYEESLGISTWWITRELEEIMVDTGDILNRLRGFGYIDISADGNRITLNLNAIWCRIYGRQLINRPCLCDEFEDDNNGAEL